MTMRTYKNPYPDSEDVVEIRFDHCRQRVAKHLAYLCRIHHSSCLPFPRLEEEKNDSFSAYKHRLFNAPAFQPD